MDNYNIGHINHSITQKEKDADDFAYYKSVVQNIQAQTGVGMWGDNGISMSKLALQANYDLYSGIVNELDYRNVYDRYKVMSNTTPSNFTHKDILSPSLKLIFGLETTRPFEWTVISTDENATSRFEETYYNSMKESVTKTLMAEVEKQVMSQHSNLSQQEKKAKLQEIQQEIQENTPENVKKYMERNYADISETMTTQLLKYLIKLDNIISKFNTNWKHVNISGMELYWIGIVNGNPTTRIVNPLRTDVIGLGDSQRIEEAEAVKVTWYLTPSQVVEFFGDVLTKNEIDGLYDTSLQANLSESWNIAQNHQSINTIRVIHCQWQALRKIGFVTQENDTEIIVSETYTFNKELGDKKIEWKFIPECHEAYQIGTDLYKYCRAVPNQHKDLSNLYERKLANYVGYVYENLNGIAISSVDRVKNYCYFYDTIFYRFEQLLASDKGKKIALNANAIPKGIGMNHEKFMYFVENSPFILLNPTQEGMKNNATELGSIAKEIDLSVANDLSRYVNILDFIERKVDDLLGLSPQMKGSIQASESVTNVRQSVNQSSYILEPFFQDHNEVKCRVLQSLVEHAKIAYRNTKNKRIQFALDDLSIGMLNIDGELLNNSTLGIFIANSSKSTEVKQMAKDLAHAAMQNQMLDFADLIDVVKSDNTNDIQEKLRMAQNRKRDYEAKIAQQQNEYQIKIQEMQEAENEKQHVRDIEKIKIKAAEDRETAIEKQAVLALGFAEDKDMDKNGIPDVVDTMKQLLAEDKFEFDKEKFYKELDIKKQELAQKAKEKPSK